jgi:hypothetical protein
MSNATPNVAVVGGGLAGATAAFRLAQRGYKVTLFEQDGYLGGQFRAVPVPGQQKYYHEHCYHLFDNWYHNFWRLIGELGLEDDFVARRAVKYLRRGEFPRITELRDVGALSSYLENLLSGVMSIPDMYLFLYSYVDLLASPMQRDRYGDVVSVNEFMHSRPYATARSAAMHDNVLFKAFGVPTFSSSVQSYRTFVGFGAVEPSPMFYVMRGNVQDHFWAHLERALVKLGVQIHLRHRLKRIELGSNGEVQQLHFERPCNSPTSVVGEDVEVKDGPSYRVDGSVVLAVPPIALSRLITRDLYSRDPRWGLVQKLRIEPMASVHLHFNAKFVDRLKRTGMKALPKEPVILLDSRFCITFLDNSGTWPELTYPYLHVIASDYRELTHLGAPTPKTYTHHGKALGSVADVADGPLDLDNPKSPLDHILAEVRRYLPFELDEVDLDLLEIDPCERYPIFINDIGSWPNRPATRNEIGNLFMAGAHCQNVINVTTVEGAVLSGLEAAAAVQRRHGLGEPIQIDYPVTRPFYFYVPWQLMGAPAAMMAKVWSELDAARKRLGRPRSPSLSGSEAGQDRADFVTDLFSAQYEIGTKFLSQLLRAFRR